VEAANLAVRCLLPRNLLSTDIWNSPRSHMPIAADPQPTAPAGDDLFAQVQGRWDAILDVVKERSRASHAMYLPGTPIRVANRILTLRYEPRYASFHAVNATRGEHSQVLAEAIERSTGLKLRIDAVIEGAYARRPQPPTVTPDDARTPVLDDGPPADEEADVREAEASTPPAADASVTDELLAAELGAELLEHRPAPEA
jgi:DNA polymerase III subunit gamma/tau